MCVLLSEKSAAELKSSMAKKNYDPEYDEDNDSRETEADDAVAVTESTVEEGTGAAAPSAADNDEIESLTRKAQENLELAQRTQAEMENLRKRTLRDIENAHKYALERFVADLLPVIDSLELGIQAADTAGDTTSLRDGMDLTLKKFSGCLEKFGVVVLVPEGEKFNPEKHEAVSMAEVDGMEPGTVMSVLQKGYELNGRLVRPAMVVVAK